MRLDTKNNNNKTSKMTATIPIETDKIRQTHKNAILIRQYKTCTYFQCKHLCKAANREVITVNSTAYPSVFPEVRCWMQARWYLCCLFNLLYDLTFLKKKIFCCKKCSTNKQKTKTNNNNDTTCECETNAINTSQSQHGWQHTRVTKSYPFRLKAQWSYTID